MRHLFATASVAATLLCGAAAFAVPIGADFRVSLDLPDLGGEPRILEALDEDVAGVVDLSDENEVSNPSGWSGHVDVGLDETGIVTVTGQTPDGFGDYDVAIIDISNIEFSGEEEITGFIAGQSEGLLLTSFGGDLLAPALSFTEDSVRIAFDTSGAGEVSDFEFADGGESTFQIITESGETLTAATTAQVGTVTAVPVPASLPLVLAGMAALGLVSRRRAKSA